MSEIAERFRRVAAGFSAAIDAIDSADAGAWSNPSPCDGWTARDVVAHLVDWIPGPGFLLGAYGIATAPIPAVDDDPAAAWRAVRDAVQRSLDDPAVARTVADCGPLGVLPFESAVAATVISDVFVHTWDLAQAAGVHVPLDDDELRRQHDAVVAIPPEVDEAMRRSGHFGPRVPLAPGADALTAVLAFYGRTPR